MEQTLSKDVQEKLDMINWDSLKEKYGVSRETFYDDPHLATQLVYGQMTDLVYASKEDFSGLLSLRANMDTSGEKPEMKVKAFTMEKKKNPGDALYLYGQPITSDKVREALVETAKWYGQDGKEYKGLANAMIEGKAVAHSGQRKNGEAFSCCIQFDAAKREPTVSHPSWYKEAQRAGMEAAPKQKQEEKAAQQQKTSQEQSQSQRKSGGLRK